MDGGRHLSRRGQENVNDLRQRRLIGGVSCFGQGELRFWELPTGKEVASGKHLRGLDSSAGNAGMSVETGTFGAMMDVEVVNHGPVTILLEVEGCG